MTHPLVDPDRLARNWRAITVELDAPKASRTERLIRRLGVRAHHARVAAATPSLRRAWYVALTAVVFVGLAAGDTESPRDSLYPMLLLAPLVPVVGVGLSFGPSSDPTYETTLSTPMRGIELVMIRTISVVSVSLVVLAATSVLVPGRSLMAFGWLVPALGLSTAAVALMTWLTPRQATAATALVWLMAATIVRNNAADPLAGFGVAAQTVMVVITVVAAAVAIGRRERFDVLQVQW